MDLKNLDYVMADICRLQILSRGISEQQFPRNPSPSSQSSKTMPDRHPKRHHRSIHDPLRSRRISPQTRKLNFKNPDNWIQLKLQRLLHIMMQLRDRRQILLQKTPSLDVRIGSVDLTRSREDLGVLVPDDAVLPSQTVEPLSAVDEPVSQGGHGVLGAFLDLETDYKTIVVSECFQFGPVQT